MNEAKLLHILHPVKNSYIGYKNVKTLVESIHNYHLKSCNIEDISNAQLFQPGPK